MKVKDFEIRELQCYFPKHGTNSALISTTSDYHFTIINYPIDQDEIIFSITPITTWAFAQGDFIRYGWIIYFFPSAYGLTNPTLEDFETLAKKAKTEIDKVLPQNLAKNNLPTDIQLQPFQDSRDKPLLTSAFNLWKGFN